MDQAPAGGALSTTASFERVMDGLGNAEKYNAVLQGLSNLIMSQKKTNDAAEKAFEEVFQLLDEMHSNKIKCTRRSASNLVDAAASSTNVRVIAQGAVYYRLMTICV